MPRFSKLVAENAIQILVLYKIRTESEKLWKCMFFDLLVQGPAFESIVYNYTRKRNYVILM